MKSLIDGTQNHQFSSSKPLSTCNPTSGPHSNNSNNNTNNGINNPTSAAYEPTSVLDLRSSPAAATAAGSDSVTGFSSVYGVVSDDTSSILPADDWESMLLSLGEKDDCALGIKSISYSAPPDSLPPFPPSDSFDQFSQSHQHLLYLPSDHLSNQVQSSDPLDVPSFDRFQLEQLIRAAESLDSDDLSLAHVILARLNHQLLCPVGKPLQRAAFYFKEALQSLLLFQSPSDTCPLSAFDTVQKIGAYKAFSDLSPLFQFANFTANQAILEAMDGIGLVHVIDFDIGLGGQWPSLMQEIAIKSRGSAARSLSPLSLRITAVIAEESMETRLSRDILCSFARELGIRFQIEFVEFAGIESFALGAIRFVDGEAVAVNFSPSVFRRTGGSGAAAFLRVLRRISPQIAVFVDADCRRENAGPPSFRRNFIDGLELYSVLLESLDAAVAVGGAAEAVRRIERFLLRPRIFRSVAAAGNRLPPWRELFVGSGMVPIQLSEFTDSQAECLLRRVPVRGFHVAKRQASMLLCWQGRELVATSAWKFR